MKNLQWIKLLSLVFFCLALAAGIYIYQINKQSLPEDVVLGERIKENGRHIKALYSRHSRNYQKFTSQQTKYAPKDIVKVRQIHADFSSSYEHYIDMLKKSRIDLSGTVSQRFRKELLTRVAKETDLTHEKFKSLIHKEEEILSG